MPAPLALPPAAEFNLLQILATSTGRQKGRQFTEIADSYRPALGYKGEGATAEEKRLRKQIENRRQYLLTDLSRLSQQLQKHGLIFEEDQPIGDSSFETYTSNASIEPDYQTSQGSSDTPQPDIITSSTFTMTDSGEGYTLPVELNLKKPFHHPDGIFAFLVTDVPIDEHHDATKLVIYQPIPDIRGSKFYGGWISQDGLSVKLNKPTGLDAFLRSTKTFSKRTETDKSDGEVCERTNRFHQTHAMDLLTGPKEGLTSSIILTTTAQDLGGSNRSLHNSHFNNVAQSDEDRELYPLQKRLRAVGYKVNKNSQTVQYFHYARYSIYVQGTKKRTSASKQPKTEEELLSELMEGEVWIEPFDEEESDMFPPGQLPSTTSDMDVDYDDFDDDDDDEFLQNLNTNLGQQSAPADTVQSEASTSITAQSVLSTSTKHVRPSTAVSSLQQAASASVPESIGSNPYTQTSTAGSSLQQAASLIDGPPYLDSATFHGQQDIDSDQPDIQFEADDDEINRMINNAQQSMLDDAAEGQGLLHGTSNMEVDGDAQKRTIGESQSTDDGRGPKRSQLLSFKKVPSKRND